MAQGFIFKDGSILIWLKSESLGFTIIEPIEKKQNFTLLEAFSMPGIVLLGSFIIE